MVAKDSHVEMTVKMNSNPQAGFFAKLVTFFVAMIRKVIGGETFFVNHFTSNQPGRVWLAPAMLGDVSHRTLSPTHPFTLSTGAYVASSGDVSMNLKLGGLKSLLAKEGLFFLQMQGSGEVWFNSYGGIEEVEVNGSYIVDNGHIVGFEGNLDFEITTGGAGLFSFLTSGEGFVCEFTGQGTVFIQSRNIPSLVEMVNRLFH